VEGTAARAGPPARVWADARCDPARHWRVSHILSLLYSVTRLWVAAEPSNCASSSRREARPRARSQHLPTRSASSGLVGSVLGSAGAHAPPGMTKAYHLQGNACALHHESACIAPRATATKMSMASTPRRLRARLTMSRLRLRYLSAPVSSPSRSPAARVHSEEGTSRRHSGKAPALPPPASHAMAPPLLALLTLTLSHLDARCVAGPRLAELPGDWPDREPAGDTSDGEGRTTSGASTLSVALSSTSRRRSMESTGPVAASESAT